MKAHRRKKLLTIIISLALLSTAVGLVLYAMKSDINHFYPPTEVKQGLAPLNKTIRVGGLVAQGSVKQDPNSLYVEFVVTDNQNNLTITFDKILPDLFREGQGIIAEGKLVDTNKLVATKVLAKHDEKYMPPEVEDSLKKYGHPGRKAEQ